MTSASTGITLSDVLARHARVRPDRTAFVDPRRRGTFGETDARVTRLANALSQRGIRRGDRVAVLGLNSLEVIETWFATARLGAIAVPLNFRLVADEIAYLLADSGAALVVVDAALAGVVERARVSSVRSVLTIGDDFESAIDSASDEPVDIVVGDQEPAFIMYTSGTTGFPKGAVLNHRNLHLHAFSSIATLGHIPDDCWLGVAPLFHTAGVSGMLPAFLTGGTVVIPPSGGFDPEATVCTIVRERVTSCWMTPSQWQMVCAMDGLGQWDLSYLRRIWWGAAPASTTLLQSMAAAFPDAEIVAAFGQTECSPITCLLHGDDAIRKIGSVGTPMLNVEARIVDDDMNDVAPGSVGEIVYQGPLVMTEYWNKPVQTAEAFGGGWFHSGDLVRQDEDGYIYVVDRKKDMIISGGENIYSAEVENVVAAHPKVAEVAIIGVPDPKWGETPLAVIVACDPQAPPTEAEIEAHCRAHLAAFKRPKRIAVVDALPRNASGKVDKNVLREQHAAPRSYAAGPAGAALLDETIGANFERTAAAHPDVDALVEVATGRSWTYAELNREVDLVARGLIASGINKGDRVGIWAPNCAEWTVVQYATAKAGAILVTINPAYRTHELAYVLRHAGVRMLLSVTEFKSSHYRSMVAEVRPEVPDLAEVVFLDSSDWESLRQRGEAVSTDRLRARMETLTPSDPINIQYTSGTTGSPKGAVLSHRNILNNGYFVTDLINFGPGDRLCIPVPFYHCFGMVMGNLGCTTHGATMVIPSAGFDPAATLAAVEQERCTALYGVPTMFIAVLGHPDLAHRDVSSLRTGIMAGAPCPVEIMKRCVDTLNMAEVSIAYGMTETSPVSCQTLHDDDLERRTATVGRAHPHVEVKIVDPETGVVVERGATGEFCTRGYSVMLGYWNDEDRTRDAIDDDGWMHTGDLAVMRDDGYCTIVGRIKDMVIRGGENVYPREIEEFLHTHPDIDDVQVIGVPDPRFGEEICAWIKMRPGSSPLDVDGVRAFATGKLAHYKIPRYVRVVEDFPMTVTGKVRKVEMRAEMVRLLDAQPQ
ncbi:long-chain-fatty-acid--CoA ligase [Mycobacterium crocinum]|nr:long-chain-fatty-acid--CoA ligase [Mycolicibacterium crocinum]